MNTKLTHQFLYMCYDLHELLYGVELLSTFKTRLVKQSEKYPDRHDPYKYRGDGFEMFVEALIKLSPVDNRIGISEYQNAPYDEAGIDGFGIGFNGKPAAVQIKFKGDGKKMITESEDNIAGFLAVAQNTTYNVNRDDFATNLLIVTTGAGLHRNTEEQFFADGVRVLNNEKLRMLVDNNLAFWDNFRTMCGV